VRLRAPEFEVDENEPFRGDVLGRKDFADALTALVRSADSSFVINLDADWGQGKSTFLRMWRQHLKVNGIPSLYFDAWESDFTRDPLLSLIGELTVAIQGFGLSAGTAQQFEKVKKVGGTLLKRAVPAIVKIGTAGILDVSDLVEETVGDVAAGFAEDQIREYTELKKSMQAFRSELQEFAEKLSGHSDAGGPLVLIVDELDRCRPDHAIRVLETIKHLFTVPGIFFVLATDSRQLANAVRHTYGLGISAEGYLRRFFDLTLELPEPDTRQFVALQFEKFGFDDFFSKRTSGVLRYDKQHALHALVALFQATNCSLRDQEKCLTLLGFAIRSTDDNHYLHPLLLCALIVLKVKNPDLYRGYCAGEKGYAEVLSYFCESPFGQRFFKSDRGYSSVIEAYLAAAPDSRHDGVAQRLFKARSEDESLPIEERKRAEDILRTITNFDFRGSIGSLSYVAQKIDFVARTVKSDDIGI